MGIEATDLPLVTTVDDFIVLQDPGTGKRLARVARQSVDTQLFRKVRSAPTTGQTVTIAATTRVQIIDPAGTLATLTVALPSAPFDGQWVRFAFSRAITTLTVSSGATISNAPTAATAGQSFEFMYDAGTDTWFRVQG